jgi:hypothetical protein
MKKSLLILLFCTFTVFVFAQKTETDKEVLPFSFGPVIGANISRLSTKVKDENISDFKPSSFIGFHVGLYARMYYHKFYFQPELLVYMKGGKCRYNINDPLNIVAANSVTQSVKLTTLDIPLLIGYNFGENLLGGRIFVGPVGSYTLAEKVKISTSGADLPETGRLNTKDAMWSVTGGIGFDVWKFTFDLRYERGLNNVSWNSSFRQHPSSFILTVGFKTL